MKQKLTLLILALFGTMGAWATETRTLYFTSASSAATSSNFVKSFTYANPGNWSTTATSNTSVPVTLTTSVANKLSGWDGAIRADESFNLTISVPEGYKITAYSFGTQTHKSGAVCTFTAGGNTATANSTSGSNAESILSQSGLDVQSVVVAVANTSKVDNECKAYLKDFTVTVSATSLPSVLAAGVYQIFFNDVQCLTSTAGKNKKEGGAYTTNGKGDFKLTVKNAASGTYYVQELASGNYLYTDKANSVENNRLRENVLSLVANKSDKEAGCTWIIEQYGPYFRLIPSENTDIAIGVWSSDSDNFWSFLEKGYSQGQLTFTNRPLNSLLDSYTINSLVNYGGFDFNTQIKSLYSTYFLSVEQQANLGGLGYPTSAGYSAFTSAFTSTGTSTAPSLIAAVEATVVYPSSGYYYIKNKGTNTYMFRDEDFDTNAEGMTLLNTESRTAKYIWHVDVDGTTINVTSLTGKPITSERTSTEWTDMTLKSAYEYKFTDGFGAFYMGYLQDPNQNGKYTAQGSGDYVSATNPRVVTSYDGDTDATKAYWLFEAVDESDYDIYTTSFVYPPSDNYVQYDGSSTTGNKKVWSGGKYFMTKDATINASEFTANESGIVTISDKTITITYSTEAIKALIDAYLDAKDVWTKVALADQVGYPAKIYNSTPNADWAWLSWYKGLIARDNVSDDTKYTSANYADLQEHFSAYLSTSNITMPTDGKVYTFTNVHPDGKKYYLNSADGTMSVQPTTADGAEATKYICHKISDNQFAFISVDDWYWMIAASSETGGKIVSKTYDTYAPLIFSRFYSNCGTSSTNLATLENTFGLMQLIGLRKGVSGNSVAIVTNGGNFDKSGGAFFNADYSSAYRMTEVSDYYNKVKLTSDGTDAYASLYLPFSVTIPEGITAYAVESVNGAKTYAHLDEIVSDGTLPANTATILRKEGQTEATTIYLSPAEDAGTPYDGNLLNGTIETGVANPGEGNIFVLGKIDNVIGLYEYTASTLAPGKAYLNAADLGVKALLFDFDDDATGINAVDNGQWTIDNEIYNLAGQRLQKTQKGINIVNGKKILK